MPDARPNEKARGQSRRLNPDLPTHRVITVDRGLCLPQLLIGKLYRAPVMGRKQEESDRLRVEFAGCLENVAVPFFFPINAGLTLATFYSCVTRIEPREAGNNDLSRSLWNEVSLLVGKRRSIYRFRTHSPMSYICYNAIITALDKVSRQRC